MLNQIEVFDIDGTITKAHGDLVDTSGFETYDLWHLTTLQLVSDEDKFRHRVTKWKESMKHGEEPVNASYDMMLDGLRMLDNKTTKDVIYNKAKELTLHFLNHNVIHPTAIKYLNHRLRNNTLCILSTANYVEGAHGFINALIQKKLLSGYNPSNLLISGSEIDWENKTINSFNVGENKALNVKRILSYFPSYSLNDIHYTFGDDPFVNDFGILNLANKKGVVIRNNKNKLSSIPENFSMSSWEDIYQTIK